MKSRVKNKEQRRNGCGKRHSEMQAHRERRVTMARVDNLQRQKVIASLLFK